MASTNDTALRLLVIDDSVEDAEAIVSALRNAGIAVRPFRPADIAEFGTQVGTQPVDVVLAAYASRGVPFADALREVTASGKDLPVIGLMDRIDEASVAEAFAAGARRLALREKPAQLLQAIRMEWADLEARRALRKLESQVRETERRCDALIESSRDPIAYIHEGMHIRANQAYLDMFGFDAFEDIEGMSLLDLVAPHDVEGFKQLLKGLSKGEAPPARYELEARTADGEAFPATMEFTSALYEGEPCQQVIFRRQEVDPALAREVEELRQRDQATGLFNRPTFLRALEDAVSDAAQNHGQHGLLLLEPDHYQRLLQDIGLDSADDIVAALANRLQRALGADTVAARFGEHTLAVLVRGSDHVATAELAERIREAFASEVLAIGTRSGPVTVSIGGVQIGEKIANVAQVLAKASQGMQSSAGVGGNRVEIFDPSATDRAEEENVLAWVARLRDALANDGFVLHYQPVINLLGEPGAAYEVLLRLDAGDGELVRPSTFMPIAAEHGLLPEIDRYVAGKAIGVIAQRARAGKPTLLLLRISEASIADDALVRHIGERLAQDGAEGAQLVLQMPEAKVFTHLREAQEFAAAIGRHGCRIGLEQFGVGLNSFQLMSHLQPHFVKIDRSFVEDLPRNPDNQARVQDIAARARAAGIRSIAEAVQDAASMSILFSAGVDYVEGEFLAPPGPEMSYEFD